MKITISIKAVSAAEFTVKVTVIRVTDATLLPNFDELPAIKLRHVTNCAFGMHAPSKHIVHCIVMRAFRCPIVNACRSKFYIILFEHRCISMTCPHWM